MAPKNKGIISMRRLRNKFCGFNTISDDILSQILTKLPAKSFAFSSCVSRSWNRVSRSILSKPKIVTALSTEKNLKKALEEVVNEVLSKPIRPQFVIASFTLCYNLTMVHEYMKKAFGKIPIITNMVEGVIGHNVQDHELTEITMEEVDNERAEEEEEEEEDDDDDDDFPLFGLALVVGWLPGLKVNAVPLLCSSHQMKVRRSGFEKFVSDIKKYTLNVADSLSPAAIIMFGDKHGARKTELMKKIDKEFDKTTAIVGHFNNYIDFYTPNPVTRVNQNRLPEAVALIIVRDKNKDNDIGETQFHIPCMKSVSQVGLDHSIVSINVDKKKRRTTLDAMSKIDDNILDEKVFHLPEEMEERIFIDDYYIGIVRKFHRIDEASTSSSPPSSSVLISLHGFEMDKWRCYGNLVVEGEDIDEGESFILYKSDFRRGLLMDGILNESTQNNTSVFGGLIFANMSDYVARMVRNPIAYSLPFVEQFKDVPVGGLFTRHIAKRDSIDFAWKNGELQEVGNCNTNRKGVSYLIMSYTPPSY